MENHAEWPEGGARKTGLSAIGDVPWGTHLCQFYQGKQDLLDVLLPYFKAGLESNELCIWITAEPLEDLDATETIRQALRELDQYLDRGSIEFIPYTEWYLRDGVFDGEHILAKWAEKHNAALEKGYDGLRIAGNTIWLDKQHLQDFVAYEKNVSRAIGQCRMLVLCLYSLDRCGVAEVIDAVHYHQFALVKRDGRWELLENPERRRMQEALRQANQTLNALIQSSPLAIGTLDRQLRVTLWNPAAERLLGWRAEEVLGRPLSVIPEDQEEITRIRAEEVFKGAMRLGDERRYRRKDGSLIDGRIWTAPLRDAEGTITGVMTILEDVTERKRMEEALRLSEARLHMALKAARIIVFHLDRDLRYCWCRNPLGLQCEQKRERDLFERADEAETLAAIEREVLERGVGVRKEVQLHIRGVEYFYDFTFEPLRDVTGHIEGIIGAAIDVTEHRKLQEKLREQAVQLAGADRRKDEFIAVLAHELRNPLAPIANAVQILKRSTALTDTTVRWAEEVIGRQVEQLTRLVNDLLDVARITRGRIELKKEVVELADIVARAVDNVRSTIEAYRHELNVNMPVEPIGVEADPTRLVQILGNLLDNAAKYTPEGGCITLIVEQEGYEAVIRVQDNGIGIAPEMLPRIFAPFTQADQALSCPRGGGLGLGLNVTQRLVHMHGGSIEAESCGLGRGSVFTVRMPLTEYTLPRVRYGVSTSVASDPQRILLVEDNADVADSFMMLLHSLGHEVQLAPNGTAALEAVRRHRPQVVFLDIGLPDMDGYEVARRLRAEHAQALRLVALTGYGQEQDRRRALEAGFDEHLLKPVDLNALDIVLKRDTKPGTK